MEVGGLCERRSIPGPRPGARPPSPSRRPRHSPAAGPSRAPHSTRVPHSTRAPHSTSPSAILPRSAAASDPRYPPVPGTKPGPGRRAARPFAFALALAERQPRPLNPLTLPLPGGWRRQGSGVPAAGIEDHPQTRGWAAFAASLFKAVLYQRFPPHFRRARSSPPDPLGSH